MVDTHTHFLSLHSAAATSPAHLATDCHNRYLGVIETVRIRRAGYPVRRPFRKFAEQFFILMPGTKPSVARKQARDHPRVATMEILKGVLGPCDGTATSAWQAGRTKVFLRHGQLQIVEEALRAKLAARAIMIQVRPVSSCFPSMHTCVTHPPSLPLFPWQSHFKGMQERKHFKKTLQRLLLLQIWLKMMLVRMRFRKQKKRDAAATAIAARARARREQQRFRRKRAAAVRLESRWRGHKAHKEFKTQRSAAIKLQATQRSRSERQQFKAKRQAAAKLNRVGRGFVGRRRVKRVRNGVVKLQAAVRKRRFRGRHVHVLRSRAKFRDVLHAGEAVLLQSLVRKRRDKGGMFHVDRRRQLVLTTHPRIMYLDPAVKDIKKAVKGVVSAAMFEWVGGWAVNTRSLFACANLPDPV